MFAVSNNIYTHTYICIYIHIFNCFWCYCFWTYLCWRMEGVKILPGFRASNILSDPGCVLVAQSCPTLCDPMNYSPSGSSVHRILQARTLEWVAMLSSRGSSQPRDRTQVSHIAGRFFTIWATRETLGIAQTKFLLREEMVAKLGVWAPG